MARGSATAGADVSGFEPTDTGYLMVAYGVVNGQAAAERPQSITTDGRRRPLLDLSGRPIPRCSSRRDVLWESSGSADP